MMKPLESLQKWGEIKVARVKGNECLQLTMCVGNFFFFFKDVGSMIRICFLIFFNFFPRLF